MFQLLYPIIWSIKKTKALSALSMRLVKITGKSKYQIHPKHLIKIERLWYLEHIKKGDKVLDLGCNNGQHSLKVAKKCRQVVGVDYDKNQLQIARETGRDKKIKNVRFVYHDLESKIPVKNNSFDKVICLDVLEHLVKRVQLIREIKRVLRPNGLAFLAIPNIETSWKKLQKKAGIKNIFADPDHKIEYTKREAREIFTKQGFKVIKFKPVVYDTPFIGFFDLLGGISLSWYATITRWKKKKAENNIIESTGFRITVKKE